MTLASQPIVAGEARGLALTTTEPLSLWGGLDPNSGEIIDRRHPLAGRYVTGRVLVLPHGRGSCSASGVLLEAIRNGVAPVAIIVSRIDPIIGLGSILGDELYGKPIPVLLLDEASIAQIEDGAHVAIDASGTITIDVGPNSQSERAVVVER